MSLPFEYTQRAREIMVLDNPTMRAAVMEQHDRELEDYLKVLVASIASASGTVPIGTIIDFGGASLPTGYLACDGSTFPTATYPDLAAVLGTTWGAAPAGSCRLPDLRDRSTIGESGTHTLGATGGSAVAQLPQHNHTATFTGAALAGHTHTFTGSALGTHTHTFTGSALAAHGHSGSTFTGSAANTGTESADHVHSIDPPNTAVAGGFGTQGNPAGWTVGAVGVIFGPSGGNSGSPSGWFQQNLTVNIAAFNSAGRSAAHSHAYTPSGTVTVATASAGTPAGTNSSVSAGTPAGTNSSVSAGTPSGTVAVDNAGVASPDNYHPFGVVRKLIRAA